MNQKGTALRLFHSGNDAAAALLELRTPHVSLHNNGEKP
ncbi:hypothetical protein R2A130_3382 [Ahrensia sp. R2A130]|nr:hypothetical protein R2A130_3382 [Ahrensia sp. R2A130]